MNQIDNVMPATIEQRIQECIDQEAELMNHYTDILNDMNPDAKIIMNQLCYEHEKHIILLNRLKDEIQMLRELSVAMVD